MLDLFLAAPIALTAHSLTLDATAAVAAQPGATSERAGTTPADRGDHFGRRKPGTSIDGPIRAPDYLTISLGVAGDGDPGTHYQLAITPSWFLRDDFEFGVELGGWYIDQDTVGADNTGGVSFRFLGRWHALHGSYSGREKDGYDWTLFLDAGIGMAFTADDVPPGGTSVNFIPTVGAGATFRLDDAGTRLVTGLRWHHMSNARINGDRNNPDFNAPMVYVGVQWGF